MVFCGVSRSAGVWTFAGNGQSWNAGVTVKAPLFTGNSKVE